MKAILIDRYGDPDVMRYGETALPVPLADEILIDVAAVGTNPADWKWRAGWFKAGRPFTFPHILGYDVAGTVSANPSGHPDFPVGTRVAAMLPAVRQGGYAQAVCAPIESVALLPDDLGFEAAATLPTAGLTALQLIDDHLKVTPGERVLILGASGAVGRFAAQIAKARGAIVTVAVRSPERVDRETSPPDKVVMFDDLFKTAERYDKIGDTTGSSILPRLKEMLIAEGIAFTVSPTPSKAEVEAMGVGYFRVIPAGSQLTQLAELQAGGRIGIPYTTLPLSEAQAVHALMETGQSRKHILVP